MANAFYSRFVSALDVYIGGRYFFCSLCGKRWRYSRLRAQDCTSVAISPISGAIEIYHMRVTIDIENETVTAEKWGLSWGEGGEKIKSRTRQEDSQLPK